MFMCKLFIYFYGELGYSPRSVVEANYLSDNILFINNETYTMLRLVSSSPVEFMAAVFQCDSALAIPSHF